MTPTRHDALIAAVAAMVLLPPTALVSFTSIPAPGAWVVVVLAIVGHAALLWRSSHPSAALLVIAGCVGGEAVVTGLFFVLPSSLVFVIAVYAATAYGTRWMPLVIGLVGSVAAAGRYAADPNVVDSGFGPSPWLLFVLFTAVVLCAWTMGLLRRSQLLATELAEQRAESERRERTQREALAAFEERARISRDMHDVLAHSLAVIVGQSRVARFDEARATSALTVIEDTARDSLHEIRVLLRGIRDDEASPDARPLPQPTLAELPELIERARSLGFVIAHSTEGTATPIGAAAQVAIYRVVQEALTNVAKHAHPGAIVDLLMRWDDDRLSVIITNDRARVRGGAETIEPGLGLLGMGERLRAVGGSLTTVDAGDGSFTVTATVPTRAEPTA
ncbi:signal transduction histidine kinase [Agromyces cerinus]|uniref:sensor histidine kinase n=1 Tax=Agromyces cerinus TaxID=33878 RepID=UPI00195BAC39|nr:histidine kinase [Agromyces cerinus]MBM7831797.1 signal transduction histidine kinase [Agromyces cerinus]